MISVPLPYHYAATFLIAISRGMFKFFSQKCKIFDLDFYYFVLFSHSYTAKITLHNKKKCRNEKKKYANNTKLRYAQCPK